MTDRLTKLLAMLDAKPGDTFLLYAAAMEYKKANEVEKALEYLDRTIQFDPNYAYAYYQKGQILESTADNDAARQTYLSGIDAAGRGGDGHAASELQGALEMMG